VEAEADSQAQIHESMASLMRPQSGMLERLQRERDDREERMQREREQLMRGKDFERTDGTTRIVARNAEGG
jgi:hypothetical protein